MSAQRQCNLIHITALVATTATLMLNFNAMLLVVGLVLGWCLWLVGVSLSLHKWAAHRAWMPRNSVIEAILLWVGCLTCLESHISWALAHRIHHRHSDTPQDPFSANNWRQNIAIGFYYHVQPSPRIRLAEWRDLPLYRWFHRHYFSVIGVSAAGVLLVTGKDFAYYACVPVLYVLAGYFWITVIAHHGGIPHDQPLAELLFAGEGHHATHHRYPATPTPSRFDLTAPLIKLLAHSTA